MLWCLSALAVGVAAGLVWLWLSHPAEWEVRSNGIVLTEAASRGQFAVIVVFVMVGAVFSFGWSWIVAWQLAELGWIITVLVILGTLAAAVVAWRLGVELGPADPSTVTDPSIGDKLPARLAVDGIAPFLAWPIFGLFGLLAAICWPGADDAASPADGESSAE